MGQVLCPEKRQEKHSGTGAHRSTHPQGQGEQGAGRTHTPQPQHYADAPQAGQARHRGTPQDRGTAPHRSTARRRKHKRVHKSTSRCAIVVAWSTRGADHTVTPNHSTCSPQRGHGTRHQSLRCVLFCVQAGHGIAVGTTQTQNAMRGEEGAAFLPIK